MPAHGSEPRHARSPVASVRFSTPEAWVDVPEGQEGRPSRAMTLGQAVALPETVESGTHWLAAYVVLSLLAGMRTEEARAITWDEVDLSPARWPSIGPYGSRVTPRPARAAAC